MMRIILLVVLLSALCSCNLEKRVVVTTRGYEQYRQAGMSNSQIKGLQLSDAARTDSLIIHKFKP